MSPPAITPSDPPARRRRNRPQTVADAIKEWMVQQGLRPGDRLPGEAALIRRFGMAKGTIREALKVLETQGLVRTRTGPGGGAFVHEVSEQRARTLLANYLFFKDISIGDIYRLRRSLEPELAFDLAGQLSGDQLRRLDEAMTAYEEPPATIEDERYQRIAELEFHDILAGYSRNHLMAFQCRFLISLLRDLTVCRRIYRRRIPDLRETGRDYQTRLLAALAAGDAGAARAIMRAHMVAAQRIMEEQEAILERSFLEENGPAPA